MKATIIFCYCISNSMTKSFAESQHPYITRSGLTACQCVSEVGVFLREISQLSKICPSPSLFKFITHGHTFERLW